ncbi:uncharacterized protein [Cicer arietinum]|uniref:Uncharacterized protein LOC101497379 isoform X2 n=1 Tax=Cicer arietinum TaxID=3827 RepID=A0A1S3E0P5_CICAR|nr:uncharacterized protein LOC101497379 isoform X2 [Cicer arietinum]
MEQKVWGCSSNEDSGEDDDDVFLQNESDDEQFHFSPASLPKLQFRNTKSKGRWNEEMGMAEVFEKNGKMYLMELGALDLLDNGDRSISLIEMYEKVAGEKSGCCWELFEAYRHLKSLGYIIGRHGVAWSLKSIRSSLKSTASEGTEDSKQFVDMVSNVELSINKLFSDLKINDLNPDFDVYLPNNRFRKSSPGDPDFLLYLSRGHLPSRAEIEALERQCGRIPLKICLVTEGKVSFFSFDKVELPVLP